VLEHVIGGEGIGSGQRKTAGIPLNRKKRFSIKQLLYAKLINYFFLIYIVGGSPSWVPSARRPLNGLLYLPRVIMMMENFVE
jgi:hypothetical protein